MALKLFPHVLFFILWLSLLLFFFRDFRAEKSIADLANIPPLIGRGRKALASSFDFAPFLNRRDHAKQREERRRFAPASPEPFDQAGDHDDHDDEIDIDPRYGVEKRRVPTGPNPLHH